MRLPAHLACLLCTSILWHDISRCVYSLSPHSLLGCFHSFSSMTPFTLVLEQRTASFQRNAFIYSRNLSQLSSHHGLPRRSLTNRDPFDDSSYSSQKWFLSAFYIAPWSKTCSVATYSSRRRQTLQASTPQTWGLNSHEYGSQKVRILQLAHY